MLPTGANTEELFMGEAGGGTKKKFILLEVSQASTCCPFNRHGV
jgi:hypothetical protein